MSGIEYLIDTNILTYILKGNPRVKYFADNGFKKIPDLDLLLIDIT